MGNFASGISHDFNNLLSGIRGSIQLAQMEGAGTSSQTELMLAALKGCDRARDLVKRILLFARGSTESVRAPVNLPDLLRETLPLIVAAVAHSITTQLRIDGDIPSVSADESQLVQVVMNLAINAAHAMEKTGGKMVLGARTASITPESGSIKGCAPGDYALLEVSDEGCGMSAAVAERIFEPFFTTKSRGKGSGLGLSVVQRIVKDHGGAIAVRSIEGRGTTFEVLLPVMSSRSPVSAKPSSPLTWHRRVIVVDDEPLVRDVLLSALRLSKHDTVTFDDALQALTWLENEANEVDLVITDFSMPGMDGLEFSHRLRALRPRIPILVIRGNFGAAPKEVRELAYSRILEKPIQLADFERAVNQLLRM